jgi:hypothetical protein
MQITRQQISQFQKAGVLLLPKMIEQHWLEVLKKGISEDLKTPGPYSLSSRGTDGRYLVDFDMWTRSQEFRNWALNGPYPSVAAGLMQSRQVNLVMDQLLINEARGAEATSWRQERSRMAVDGPDFITFWTSLYPTSKECSLQFVCGSHRIPELGLKQSGPGETLDAENHNGTVSYGTNPGDCLVFFSDIVYRGLENAGGSITKVSIITRYAGDNAFLSVRMPPTELPHDPPLNARHGVPLSKYERRFPKVWPRKFGASDPSCTFGYFPFA